MSGRARLLYVRYQLTDLAAARDFLVDFGLEQVEAQGPQLFMRGFGSAPFLYEAVLGDSNKFLGAGFEVGSLADLERMAAFDVSHPVEMSDAPGGGYRVRMVMPDGFEIDAVHGIDHAPLNQESQGAFVLNSAHCKPRSNASIRVKRQRALVNKLGHFVLHVSDHDESVRWLQDRLGMVASDYMAAAGALDRPYGTFLRFDQGKTLVDHHCLLVLASENVSVHHVSFEVNDLDAVMTSHDYLLDCGYTLDVGVGRHLLGSQIFDYWRDPFGFRVEHYTDGDVVNDEHSPATFTGSAAETTQWGAKPPAEFFQ